MKVIDVELDFFDGGFDLICLKRLGIYLCCYVDDGYFLGINVFVSCGGKVVYYDVYGYCDVECFLFVENDIFYCIYLMMKFIILIVLM